jgi:hypothetical protein
MATLGLKGTKSFENLNEASAEVALRVSHPDEHGRTVLSEETKEALARDLA